MRRFELNSRAFMLILYFGRKEAIGWKLNAGN